MPLAETAPNELRTINGDVSGTVTSYRTENETSRRPKDFSCVRISGTNAELRPRSDQDLHSAGVLFRRVRIGSGHSDVGMDHYFLLSVRANDDIAKLVLEPDLLTALDAERLIKSACILFTRLRVQRRQQET